MFSLKILKSLAETLDVRNDVLLLRSAAKSKYSGPRFPHIYRTSGQCVYMQNPLKLPAVDWYSREANYRKGEE